MDLRLFTWIFGFLLEHYTGLSMTGSLYTVDEYGRGEFLSLRNLILPALTLGMRPLAVVTELTRTSLLEAMSMDYVRTARAKGLKPWRVICVHALRNRLERHWCGGGRRVGQIRFPGHHGCGAFDCGHADYCEYRGRYHLWDY